jgi:hypothetical protein
MSATVESIRRRAAGCCEYCRLPQSAFARPFHIEHIVARQHGGSSLPDNLALACWDRDRKKGPNLSGIDPQTGLLVPLFNPRKDTWIMHFSGSAELGTPRAVSISGLTAVGRATVQVLAMNDTFRRTVRYELWREGLYSLSPVRDTPDIS